MNFLARLGVLFYVTITMFVGCSIALYVFHVLNFDDVMNLLFVIYYDPAIRGIFAIIAFIILLKNYVYWKTFSIRHQRGRTIAFDNPAGQVSVSVKALEDMIRRVIARVPEVKDVRTLIAVGKKGLDIYVRLDLNADVNIPEATSRLQDLVKSKIQDTIGVEEKMTIRIDVTKIIPDHKKVSRKREEKKVEESAEPNIPFQGYRA